MSEGDYAYRDLDWLGAKRAIEDSLEHCCSVEELDPCPKCRYLADEYVAAAKRRDHRKGD